MIISHRHRFIFIKTRKTAGTSIEIALSKFCGPDDVITPVLEEAARSEYGGRAPQHFRRGFTDFRPYDYRRFLFDRRRQDFRNHLPGPRIRQMIPRTVWDGYFKFCVERNPYDKVISGHAWSNEIRRREGRPQLSLDAFVQGDYIHDYKCWHRYAVGHQIIVDRVLRFEELDAQLPEVCGLLGLPQFDLPRAKGGIRTDKRPVFEVLGQNVDRVSEVFREELEILGV